MDKVDIACVPLDRAPLCPPPAAASACGVASARSSLLRSRLLRIDEAGVDAARERELRVRALLDHAPLADDCYLV
eukprot:CAMPEP_0185483624 /NCGR_PEP_ID=MMETSP1366-20130426/8695_1 /TAXON_ID=38817 /ORGANISM="Gephyrocapsa oceanica, Strain RCC1303" /LENGTH=74 /DNA_ID=CAMNT_0028091585 /DNA_START=607 /DNA_END=829 /DNA_ORIENTATION=-